MNIGHKIVCKQNEIAVIKSITDIVPVSHHDDGTEWYEVCEPHITDIVAILGKDNDNKEVVVIMKKSEDNVDLMSDILL